MSDKIKLNMQTLDNIFEINNLNPMRLLSLGFDIQGAEYIALKGAKNFAVLQILEIEISKKQYYEGGANWNEIKKLFRK